MHLVFYDYRHDSDRAIGEAKKIPDAPYEKEVLFHAFWYGDLSEKHLYSIKSCYYFNVLKTTSLAKRKIILWVQNNNNTQILPEIQKYAEVRPFDYTEQSQGTPLEKWDGINRFAGNLAFYADITRVLLLYNYGGLYFDLDIFFLRNFDGLFHTYGDKSFVYTWELQNYPNNAIFFNPESKSSFSKPVQGFREIITFIRDRNRGFGFQQAQLTFDLPLDLTVLPCAWFDPCWVVNSANFGGSVFFLKSETKYTLDTFFPGAFCYHWHNKWNDKIEENSPMDQLMKDLDTRLAVQ